MLFRFSLRDSHCTPKTLPDPVIRAPWTGCNYRMFDCVPVLAVATVSWDLPEGPCTYWLAV
jgi:hypothetical protein